MVLLMWRTERAEDSSCSFSVMHILTYEDRRIAVVVRRLYTRDFHVTILPTGLTEKFGSLDEAKAFAMDCAKDCMSEWACRSC